MQDLKDAKARRVVRSREREIHLCRCRALDVITQGPTEAAARQNLTEAVTLFLESCAELGSRDEIFRELGFRDTPAGVSPPVVTAAAARAGRRRTDNATDYPHVLA